LNNVRDKKSIWLKTIKINFRRRRPKHKMYLYVYSLCRNCLLKTRYWRRDRRKDISYGKMRKKT